MSTVARPRAIVAVTALALLLPGAAIASEPVTLSIAQDPPSITLHDLGADGWGVGDLFTFHATAVAADGRPARLSGDHNSVALPAGGPHAEHRISSAIFDLGNGDSVVFVGTNPIGRASEMIAPGMELARAIVGGTGAYAGARGEIRTVRAEDGSLDHVLVFTPADPANAAETVTVRIPVPEIALTDITTEAGIGVGDLRTWHADAVTTDGAPVGAYGVQHLTEILSDDGSSAEAFGYAFLDFGGGDLLVGVTVFPVTIDGSDSPAVVPIDRAIVGGTGRFAGARGTQHMERGADGSLELVTELLADPADAAERSLVLTMDAHPMTELDRGPAGESRGDRRVWEHALRTEDGEAAVARGYATTLDVAEGADTTREVASVTVFTLPDGSTLVAVGLDAEDPAGARHAHASAPRAVIGGTGAYAGVSGEVITEQGADGAGVLTFTLRG